MKTLSLDTPPPPPFFDREVDKKLLLLCPPVWCCGDTQIAEFGVDAELARARSLRCLAKCRRIGGIQSSTKHVGEGIQSADACVLNWVDSVALFGAYSVYLSVLCYTMFYHVTHLFDSFKVHTDLLWLIGIAVETVVLVSGALITTGFYESGEKII